jgi:hypothetical protein
MILNELEMRLECGRINKLVYEFNNAESIETMEHCHQLLLVSLDDVRKYKTKKILERGEK